MPESLDHPNDDEKIRMENDFLKMKMMLESGAIIHSKEDVSPELENHFLNYVQAFEDQAKNQKQITVFEKLGSPDHLRSVNEISDDDIGNAWKELLHYMNEQGVDLAACSPNITDRELYRFSTEELFKLEMDDINVPGVMNCFTYDEFYPDHVFDNTNHAIDDCITEILSIRPMEFVVWFAKENVRLNHYTALTDEELKQLVNDFKSQYDDIVLTDIDAQCVITGEKCIANGTYEVILTREGANTRAGGNWLVEFCLDDLGYWNIINVQIEGVNF